MERPRSTGARQVEALAGCTASTAQIIENLAARVSIWTVENCLLSALVSFPFMLQHYCARLQWYLDGVMRNKWCSAAFVDEIRSCLHLSDVLLRVRRKTKNIIPWHTGPTAGITLRNTISYNFLLRLVLVNER